MPIYQLPIELLLEITRYLSIADVLSCILLSKHFNRLLENELYLKALALDAEEGLPLRSHVVAAYRFNLTALKRFIRTRPDIDYTQVKTFVGKYANLLPEVTSVNTATLIISRQYFQQEKGGSTTLLHVVSILGQTEIVPLILESRGDVAATDFMGRTALHIAAFGGHNHVLQLLIDAGADVSAFTQLSKGKLGDLPSNPSERTALHYATWEGHDSTVQLLLDAGADPSVLEIGGWEWPPLLYAVEGEDSELVKILLDGGADPLARTLHGATGLHLTRSIDVARLLLEVCPSLHECLDNNQKAPVDNIHDPFREEDMSVFLVESGGEMDSPAYSAQSLLHSAAEEGHDRVVEALLKRDQTLLQRVTQKGETALHSAAVDAQSGARCANILINAGIDIFAVTNPEKETALHHAVRCYDATEFVRILIQAGIDVSQENRDGNTALHIVSDNVSDNGDVAPLLIAETSVKGLSSPNKAGLTPLHHAARTNREDIVDHLLSAGGDPSIVNNHGQTPLFLTQNLEIITLLINAAIDSNVNRQDSNDNTTALHSTAERERLGKSLLSLPAGANLDLQDNSGNTVLHEAVSARNRELVEFFLENGADTYIQNNRDGRTPLHLATKNIVWHFKRANSLIYDGELRDKMVRLIDRGPMTVESVGSALGLNAIELNSVHIVRELLDAGADSSIRDNVGLTAMEYLRGSAIPSN